MRNRTAALTALFAVALGTSLPAGEKKEPPRPPEVGPEHKLLHELAGTYEANVTIYAGPDQKIQSKGSVKRELILNGRFLKEDYEGTFGDQPFKGLGLTGYDTTKKKYVGSWVDSMSNALMTSEGTYDAKTKTYTHTGQDVDVMTGKALKARDVIRIVGPDEQVVEMYRQPVEGGGKEFKMMEIVYKRKK